MQHGEDDEVNEDGRNDLIKTGRKRRVRPRRRGKSKAHIARRCSKLVGSKYSEEHALGLAKS